ncbi:MAG: hypothetical protein IEMM0002_1510 [bacterium]|nr:MAG: hypothetical protein IEMM0002_1510 [bacterium]
MRVFFLATVVCFFISMPAEAANIDKKEAIKILTTHIARDEAALSSPANVANTRQTRLRLKNGIQELKRITEQLEIMYGKNRKMIHELSRILEEEKKEADNPSISHRNRKGLRNMLKNNLEVKQRALLFLKKGVPFDQPAPKM